MYTPERKPSIAELERAIQARHMERVRAICATKFTGDDERQQANRNAQLQESERQVALELQVLRRL